jgi:hypothetical protein
MMFVFLEHVPDLRIWVGLIILRISLIEESSIWMIIVHSLLQWSQYLLLASFLKS